MPELTVVTVPINVLIGERRSKVPDHDFEALAVERGEAGEKYPVDPFRFVGDITGMRSKQRRDVDAAPRCYGLHGLAIAQTAIVPERD